MKKSKILSRKNENDNNLLVGDQLEQTKQLYMKMLKLIRKNRPKNNHSNNNDQLNDDELMTDINKMINLQIQLQNDASQRHSMVYFQENYEKHLLNISTIKSNINFDISYILEGIFGRNFTDDEVLFVLDIEFLKQLSPLLLDTPNR